MVATADSLQYDHHYIITAIPNRLLHMKSFMHRRVERLSLRTRNTTASEPRSAINRQRTMADALTLPCLTTLHRLHHGAPIAILARHPLRLQGQQLCTRSHNIILLLWFVSSTDLHLIATACLSTRSAQQNGYSKFQIWFNYGYFDCIWRMNSCSYFHQMNCKQQYWMMNKVLVLAKVMINWQHNAWQQQHNNQSGVSWLCL